MFDKTCTLAEAITLVADGQTLALGGMTLYRQPVAFTHALINQDRPPRDLTLLAFTAGFAGDLLVGAGLVARTRTCYFGLETFGLAPMFTAAVQAGQVQVIEESEASLACGLRATLAGTGFMPSQAWQGTEMFSLRPDVQSIVDPYTGRSVTAFPAIHCDIAVIHVLRADYFGNGVLGGNPTIDVELVLSANQVVLTAEQVVPQLNGPLDFTGHTVSAVVHTPQGAWPTSCYPLYPLDGEEILRYTNACQAGEFSTYIREQVGA